MQTKLIELEKQEKDVQSVGLMRIQGVIDEISEDRFDLYEEAGKYARPRLDMKTQYDRANNQCGDRWRVVRQLFDGA